MSHSHSLITMLGLLVGILAGLLLGPLFPLSLPEILFAVILIGGSSAVLLLNSSGVTITNRSKSVKKLLASGRPILLPTAMPRSEPVKTSRVTLKKTVA